MFDLRFSNLPYFNSIKVQLKPAAGGAIGYTLFQFHKGTIKTLRLMHLIS